LDIALENACFQQHAWGYFTFKHLLGCSDDRTLPLVEKSAIQWVFGLKTAFNCRQGPEHRLFFCAAFTLYYEESERDHSITAKKMTKLINSHQKRQEYIKSKSPLYIL